MTSAAPHARKVTLAIEAARSADHGATWTDLGIVLEAPRGGGACGSSNRCVIGGVGDVSAVLDHDRQDVFLFFSQNSRDRSRRGMATPAWSSRSARPAPEGVVLVM